MNTETARNSKIKLGVFVSIGILSFIVMIYFIGKRQQLFSDTFRVSGIFFDIGGLQVGNNVRFSGINVGVVENIQQVTDSTVQVDMLITDDTRKFIKKNAVAIIGSDGLMGNKLVMIVPGVPGKETIAHNDFIETIKTVSADDILLSLKTTTNNAASITGNLAAILTNMRDGKGVVGKLLMDSILAERVDRALVNIEQGAGGFKQNMDAASHSFLLKGYLKKKEAEKDKNDRP